ncbi:hypothetical protein LSH36_317g00024 [Paralvinella palmiformis]|uniref:Mismatch repair endonuclease PMS2 n=1 Tax=Paralvinella palmiformis TaxID=53620 RepID=A0AAD9N293_9ANNE|nr:hypothetical protein LSH36_317g00024 [Paralvinella palmiformis]
MADTHSSSLHNTCIHAIDKTSVHRICSGQVVLNLATAIKELVENSVDAGANNVEVRLKDYGRELVEVVDNGKGVKRENFAGLTLKHHTSKLKDFSDLVNVDTFGFRGEALSSLCALSKMSVITCHESAEIGTKLEYDSQGKIIKQVPFPRQATPNEEICTEFGIGYVSSSEHGLGRSSGDRQFYFINKRPCDPQKISRLVNDVYHMYNRHQYPFVVLDISLSKDSVDVNVTPDKRQIFIQEEKLLLAMLKSSLINMFEPRSAIYKVSDPNIDKKPGSLGSWHIPKSPIKSDVSSSMREKQKFAGSLASNLKRRFSSIYAKSTEEPNCNQEPKQRKLDSFVISKFQASDEAGNEVLQSSDCSTSRPGVELSSPQHRASAVTGSDSGALSTSTPADERTTSSDVELEAEGDNVSNVIVYPTDVEHTEDEIYKDDSVILPVSSGETSPDTDDLCPHFKEDNNSLKVEDGVVQGCIRNECRGIGSPVASNKLAKFARFTGVSPIQPPCGGLIKPSRTQTPVRKALRQFIRRGTTPVEVNNPTDAICLGSNNVEHPAGISRDGICDVDTIKVDSLSSSESGSLDRVRLTSSSEGHPTEHVERDEAFTVTFTEYDESEKFSKKERKIEFSMDKLKLSLQNRKMSCEEARRFRNFRAQIKPTDNQAAEDELKKEISKDMFSKMEIIGQFNLGFIVTRLSKDLFIIDQHATDEKYNFEQLQKHTVIQSQKLIQPQRLELTAANECILIDNLEIFHSNGFDFVIDEDDIEELIFMLTDSPGVMCRPSRIRQMFASRSCRKSIMIGTALNKTEMKKLVSHMGELDQPWNCPHGRPTMRHLINLDMLPD